MLHIYIFHCSNSYLSSTAPGDETLRISKTTTDFNKFKLLSESFVSRMNSQGANLKSIERCLCKI